MVKKTSTQKLEKISKEIRKKIIWMSYNSKVGHLGSALSIVDIIVVLYFSKIKVFPHNPTHNQRDRFILSKGHAASALYAVLSKKGFFPDSWLQLYCKNNGKLGTHPDHYNVPGIEWTTGSLGHGLSVGVGVALAHQLKKTKVKTYVLISDAESQEGEIWEAALTAAHHKLHELIVIVDYNKVQAFGKIKEVLGLEPFQKKWQAFGWNTKIVNGHNIQALSKALTKKSSTNGKPTIIIANTIRGKGVSFMNHKIQWYYNYPRKEDFEKAMKELEKDI